MGSKKTTCYTFQLCQRSNGPNQQSPEAEVLGFTRQLANELAPFGARLNAAGPGLTLSERVEVRLSAMEESQRKELSAAVPLGRLGDPREIADAILFLSTDASSYIIGATLDVSGRRFIT